VFAVVSRVSISSVAGEMWRSWDYVRDICRASLRPSCWSPRLSHLIPSPATVALLQSLTSPIRSLRVDRRVWLAADSHVVRCRHGDGDDSSRSSDNDKWEPNTETTCAVRTASVTVSV